MENRPETACPFEQWMDKTADFIKKNRQDANIVVLIYTPVGNLEACYSNADPILAKGILHSAIDALDHEVREKMAQMIKAAQANQPEQLFNQPTKPKVH